MNTLNTFENTRAFSSRIFMSKYQLQISTVALTFCKERKNECHDKEKIKNFFLHRETKFWILFHLYRS